MSIPPNRTPFDDDLLADPNAPRHTQPLPSQNLPQNTGANASANSGASANSSTQSSNATPLPSGPSTVSGAPVLPPQFVPTAPISTPTSTLKTPRKMPMSFVVGLAMVGGALAVIVVTTAFGRMIPPKTEGIITAEQERERAEALRNSTPMPQAPGFDDTNSSEKIDQNLPTPEPPKVVIVPKPDTESSIPKNENSSANSSVNSSDETPEESSSDTNSSEASPTPTSEIPAANSNENSSNDDDSSTKNSSSSTNNSKIEYSNDNSGKRFSERRRNYSIEPPAGFSLAKRGRRTSWRGPNDSQFLVEVGAADGASPREGWTKLEASLQKKYGARYQSRGIRDTKIGGRDAAIWEFEIETPKGRVRKIDVAVHDGKRGFAVLAAAPVEDFEKWRPQFDSAIRSLQIDESRTSSSTRNSGSTTSKSAEKTAPSPTPNGY